MKRQPTPLELSVFPTILLLVALLSFPRGVRAECAEFKIVEYEDRVEAVCVGEPPTEAQKKAALEEQKRLDQEAYREKIEERNRQREQATAEKIRADAEAATERRRKDSQPVTPPQKKDINRNNPIK
jgi:hypothetical protein